MFSKGSVVKAVVLSRQFYNEKLFAVQIIRYLPFKIGMLLSLMHPDQGRGLGSGLNPALFYTVTDVFFR